MGHSVKFRPTRRTGDFLRTFSTEDGKHIRGEHQELGPAMRRAKLIQEAQAHRGTGITDRRYIGSVPFTVITDWLNKRGYTIDQWARNEGGSPCPAGSDPVQHAMRDGGVKSEFLRYFLSRDFSKLHTQHTTTKRESNVIAVPSNYNTGRDNGIRDLRGTKD